MLSWPHEFLQNLMITELSKPLHYDIIYSMWYCQCLKRSWESWYNFMRWDLDKILAHSWQDITCDGHINGLPKVWQQFLIFFVYILLNVEQGTIEMLLSGAICGVIYALFSGQPLTIVGATGPLLVFESIVFEICRWDQLDSTKYSKTKQQSHEVLVNRVISREPRNTAQPVPPNQSQCI